VSSLCPIYFSSPATLGLPPTTLAILSQPTHIGRVVSRPVKSRSYRHSGRTDSIHRCCYKCYQRSQFTTEDNAEPSFQHRINCLCQFTVPPPGHLCQPHLCGRGLRQCPANQPRAVWGTVNDCAWRRFAVHWLPAKHFPRHTDTAKGGRPLAQDHSHRHPHSGSTSPQQATK